MRGDRYDIGIRQIGLVQYRDDFQPLGNGQVRIGNRLCLDALGCVDDENGSFARGQAALHFVGKIHVSRGIDEVQQVHGTILRAIVHSDRMRLDGDSALPLKVHIIEHLLPELTLIHGLRLFDQPVRQRRFPVIDMGDDAEIANSGH